MIRSFQKCENPLNASKYQTSEGTSRKMCYLKEKNGAFAYQSCPDCLKDIVPKFGNK